MLWLSPALQMRRLVVHGDAAVGEVWRAFASCVLRLATNASMRGSLDAVALDAVAVLLLALLSVLGETWGSLLLSMLWLSVDRCVCGLVAVVIVVVGISVAVAAFPDDL